MDPLSQLSPPSLHPLFFCRFWACPPIPLPTPPRCCSSLQIGAETVGFAVAEVCRTCLGFAGGRKWLQFDDAAVKAAAQVRTNHITEAGSTHASLAALPFFFPLLVNFSPAPQPQLLLCAVAGAKDEDR